METWLPRVAIIGWTCASIPVAAFAQEIPAPSEKQPRLVLSATEHDFGRLPPGVPGKIELRVRNAGDQPLSIHSIRTTCLCLKANVVASTIPPRGETVLRAVLDLPVPYVDELIEEQVLIYSNDPASSVTKVLLTGVVGTAIRLEPTAFVLAMAHRRDLAKLEIPAVRLTASDRKAIGELKLTPSKPWITAEARTLPDGTAEVSAKVSPMAPAGGFTEYIRVATEHPEVPVIDIPVVGVIMGDLDYGGHAINFGFVKENTPAWLTVGLLNRSDKEIRVLRTETNLPVPAEVKVTNEGKEYKVFVKIAGGPAFTSLKGFIDLYTDSPADPRVRLEVAGGILSERPFEQVKLDGSDARFMQIVKHALARGDKITPEQFYSLILGGVRDERAIDLLLRAASEPDLATRMYAVERLGDFPVPHVLDRLKTLITQDPHHFVRRNALVGYVEAMGKAALPEMVLALQDEEGWVREDAAIYLGKYGDTRHIPLLRAALNDPDPYASSAVREALTALQAKGR